MRWQKKKMFHLEMYMKNKYLPSKAEIDSFIKKNCILKPRLSNKEKVNAVLRQAVWSKKIKKPKACSQCGSSDKRICGHHHNGYLKGRELDVVWLCDSCHSLVHRR
jgi:hypothetical protein